MNKDAINQYLTNIAKRKNRKPENDEKRRIQAIKNINKANEKRANEKQTKITPNIEPNEEKDFNPFSKDEKIIVGQKIENYDELRNEIAGVKNMFNEFIEGKKRKKEEKMKEIQQTEKITNNILTQLPSMLAQYRNKNNEEENKSILKLSNKLSDSKANMISKLIK